MTGSKLNHRQRSRSPRRSKSQYREIEGNKDLFKLDRFERSKSQYRKAGEINDSPESNRFEQQQQKLIDTLNAKLTFLENQNSDMICQLNALTVDRDACVRKYEASDSASHLMAEKLIEQEQTSFQHIVRLTHALETNKSKDDKIIELEESLKVVKEENQKLENTVDEKRKHILHYKNKSDSRIARVKELEKELEDKNKEIDTMIFNMQAKDKRIQELISQNTKGSASDHPTIQVNSLLKTSVESALEMNQENIGNEVKEDENSVDSSSIDSEEKIQIAQKCDMLKEQSLCSSPKAFLTFSNLPTVVFCQPSTAQSGNYLDKSVQNSDSSFSMQSKYENGFPFEVITID